MVIYKPVLVAERGLTTTERVNESYLPCLRSIEANY